MNQRNFFAELKRRNVDKVAVAYPVVAWLLIQIAPQVFLFFEVPNRAVRLVVLLLALIAASMLGLRILHPMVPKTAATTPPTSVSHRRRSRLGPHPP